MPMDWINRKARKLTSGEVDLVDRIFGSALDSSRVRIHHRRYLPGQPLNAAMAPNGAIYYPFGSDNYQPDFSAETYLNVFTGKILSEFERLRVRHVFMHEMAHVWQHQMGERLRLKGFLLHGCRALRMTGDPYLYSLREGKFLDDYNFEQRAEILANYFLLKFHRDEPGAFSIVESCDQDLGATDYEGSPRPSEREAMAKAMLMRYEKTLEKFLLDPCYPLMRV